jgi:hypothetical protein
MTPNRLTGNMSRKSTFGSARDKGSTGNFRIQPLSEKKSNSKTNANNSSNALYKVGMLRNSYDVANSSVDD